MEETTVQIQNYELAIHLRPEVNEGDLQKYVQEIEQKIVGLSGNISKTSEAERVKLSYPIGQTKTSQFLYIDFSVPNSQIADLESTLKLNNAILRSNISLKIKEEPLSIPRRTFVPKAKPIPRIQEEKVEVKQEELDKRLEEILGNI